MSDETQADDDRDPALEALLAHLHRSRGIDFSGYKKTSLGRRIRKRMQDVGVESFADYTDYLEVHPDEFVPLFNTILINVTDFFRDPAAWEVLANVALPRLLGGKANGEPVRVWCAGCASGQEAYTLAMVLAEALGTEAFCERVKIYGKDIDEEALNQARQAVYTAREVESVKPELLAKYFEPSNGRYSFRKELRRCVIFGRHDLYQDAPISRLDLLSCRNVLMYFNAEAQARILERFHFAVDQGGVLFLGKAEMLLSRSDSFVPLDLRRRLFVKQSASPRRPVWLAGRADFTPPAAGALVNHVRLREATFDVSPVPQVVFDPQGSLVLANAAARTRFALTDRAFGQPDGETDALFRPLELRGLIETAKGEQRAAAAAGLEWRRDGSAPEVHDLEAVPLRDGANGLLGVAVTFQTVTTTRRLQEDLQRSHRELEATSEELQSSNEELETTNEELQSTVEELETTNEELQSTNEELETMNEELQSANEELQTINEELRQRSDELNHVNHFLESILSSFRGGVVVVDRDLLVLVWNHRSEDLWGLRAEEVQGKNFLNLDIGLPAQQLRQPIWQCLAGEETPSDLPVGAVNRRGKAIQCRVNFAPLLGAGGERTGVIVLTEEIDNGKPV